MPVTVEIDASDADTTGLVSQAMTAAEAPPTGYRHAESLTGDIVPMVLFLAIAVTYCMKYYFAHRTRQEVQHTVRLALERGQPLTSELLDRLGQPGRPKNADLRRGVIAVSLGCGIAGLGLVIGEPDAVRPMLGVGLVPLLLGLAYLTLWRVGGGNS